MVFRMVFSSASLRTNLRQTLLSSRSFNLSPLFPGATPSPWRRQPGQHDLVRGNTCRTMMNGSVVPGRGECDSHL